MDSVISEPTSASTSSAAPAPLTRDRRGPHFLRAAAVGTIAGIVAVGFQWSIVAAERLRVSLLDRMHLHPAWGWAVLPLVGLLLASAAGYMVQRWAPDAAGSGIPHVKAVLLRSREMRWKSLLPVKFVGGFLSIASGLSMGREGPTVQMGAAIGRAAGDVLGLRARSIPQLISCGAGAGLAAAFNAPLAGFIFVLEELHREMSALTYGGALVAAVCADIVTRTFTGQLPSFSIKGYPALPLSALPAVAVLGIVGGIAGVLFNRSVRLAQHAGRVSPVPRWLQPGLAAVVVGLVAWWIPDAAGGGHVVAERLLGGQMQVVTLGALAVLLLVKYAVTVLCYSTGAPGGVFAPMLLIGALVGSIVGRVTSQLVPSLADHQPAFAVLGMAVMFAACVRAPLTGIVLILEMTANYEQLFALCVACLVAYLIAERMRDRPLYDALLEDDLTHIGRGLVTIEPIPVVMGVQRGSALDGCRLADSPLPRDCVVVGVERTGRELHPSADLELSPGDHVTVLVPGSRPEDAMRVVDLCRAG